MEAEYAAKYEAKYIEKGIQQGLVPAIEALRRIILRLLSQRFGEVPESVRQRVEAIDALEPLTELAEKVLVVGSVDEMGLSSVN